jgi:hypothetical protein
MAEPRIFVSYAAEDASWAEQLGSLLAKAGLPHTKTAPPVGVSWADWTSDTAKNATHTLVLVGSHTRLSRWVDREIELSTECRDTGPGAALIGLILPTHEDFKRPYYDPEHVPLRLHDLVQTDYALVRKWSGKPEEIRQWLEDAEKRRHYRRPEPSLGAAAQLYRFAWDAAVDEARGHLDSA